MSTDTRVPPLGAAWAIRAHAGGSCASRWSTLHGLRIRRGLLGVCRPTARHDPNDGRSPVRASMMMKATWFVAPSTTSAYSTSTPASCKEHKQIGLLDLIQSVRRKRFADPNGGAQPLSWRFVHQATDGVSSSLIFISKVGYCGTTTR